MSRAQRSTERREATHSDVLADLRDQPATLLVDGSGIDRAALEVTLIRRGTKLDNLVQVAHNCQIGEDCMIVSQVGISGSTKIGNHTNNGTVGVGGVTGAKACVGDTITDTGLPAGTTITSLTGTSVVGSCVSAGNTSTVNTGQGGGGIYFAGTATASPPPGFTPGTLIIRGSTIDHNTSATVGGGVMVDGLIGTLQIQNSTISDKSA